MENGSIEQEKSKSYYPQRETNVQQTTQISEQFLFGNSAETVHVHGGSPTPIIPSSKRPNLTNWNGLEPDQKTIRAWGKKYKNYGIGLIADRPVNGEPNGHKLAGFDVDIYCPEIAELVYQIFVKMFQDRGTIMARIGQPPKVLMPILVSDLNRKIELPILSSDFDQSSRSSTDKSKPSKIEILSKGQQFVISGIHPDTGREYEWISESTPFNKHLSTLPHLTKSDILDFCVELQARLDVQFPGWRIDYSKLLDKYKSESHNLAASPNNCQWPSINTNRYNPENTPISEVKKLIRKSGLDPNCHNDGILICFMIKSWDSGPLGKQVWEEIASTTKYPNDHKWVNKCWNSAVGDKPGRDRITLASAEHIGNKREKSIDEQLAIQNKIDNFINCINDASDAVELRTKIAIDIRNSDLPDREINSLAQVFKKRLNDFGQSWTISACRDFLKPQFAQGDLVDSTNEPTILSIVNLLISTSKFFIDEEGTTYIFSEYETTTIAINSSDFSTAITNLAREKFQEVLSPLALKMIANAVEAFGSSHASECKSEKRVAHINGDTYVIDRANEANEKITLNADNGIIVTRDRIDKVIFRTPKGSTVFPSPEDCTDYSIDAMELFQHINVPENSRTLILVWLLTSLMSNFLCPMLWLVAAPGTGKTSLVGILNSLVNPMANGRETMTMPSTIRDFIATMKNNHIVAYDNVSKISKVISDFLCSVVTRSMSGVRKLYEDDELHNVILKNPLIASTTNNPVNQPDLASRCIFIELEPLITKESASVRRNAWELARPNVWGALLRLMLEVIRILPDIPTTSSHRMTDYVRVGKAIHRIYGLDEEAFEKQLIEMQDAELADSLEDEPGISELKRFMFLYHREGWTGSMDELLCALRIHAQNSSNQWNIPKSAKAMVSTLKAHREALSMIGIDLQQAPRKGNVREWQLTLNTNAPCTSAPCFESEENDDYAYILHGLEQWDARI